MSRKCERCGMDGWAGEIARAYFVRGSVVADICTKCEDAFRDLPWVDELSARMLLGDLRYKRLTESPDASEERALELMRESNAQRDEARAKVKEWLRAGVTALLLALALATAAYADVIAGGPRQQLDAVRCRPVYRPVWEEYDWVLPEGVVQFGPEAEVPAFLSGTLDEEHAAAHLTWTEYAKLNATYAANALIGYDQLFVTMAVLAQSELGQSGPLLSVPRYTGDLRAYRIATTVWALSWKRHLTQEQLDLILATMLETPTCGGVSY